MGEGGKNAGQPTFTPTTLDDPLSNVVKVLPPVSPTRSVVTRLRCATFDVRFGHKSLSSVDSGDFS